MVLLYTRIISCFAASIIYTLSKFLALKLFFIMHSFLKCDKITLSLQILTILVKGYCRY